MVVGVLCCGLFWSAVLSNFAFFRSVCVCASCGWKLERFRKKAKNSFVRVSVHPYVCIRMSACCPTVTTVRRLLNDGQSMYGITMFIAQNGQNDESPQIQAHFWRLIFLGYRHVTIVQHQCRHDNCSNHRHSVSKPKQSKQSRLSHSLVRLPSCSFVPTIVRIVLFLNVFLVSFSIYIRLLS